MRVHLPRAMSPVTYSRKVRRTPQSTAPSTSPVPFASLSAFPVFSAFFGCGLFGAGLVAVVRGGCRTSAERLTGSRGLKWV